MRRPARPHPQPRPPTGRPRTRRFIKSSATITTVFFLSLWLTSHIWRIIVGTNASYGPAPGGYFFQGPAAGGDGWAIFLRAGGMTFVRHEFWWLFGLDRSWGARIDRIPDWGGFDTCAWRPHAGNIGGGRTLPGLPFDVVMIPLWIPTALALAVTLTAWRCDIRAHRRDRRGLCPRCGYDLTGLTPAPAAVTCPECGAAS